MYNAIAHGYLLIQSVLDEQRQLTDIKQPENPGWTQQY